MPLCPNYEDHVLSEIFPLMGEVELQELANDMEVNGQRDPIWLYEGKILDGRNRYRAAKMKDMDLRVEHYKGRDPIGFVVSKNLRRRHLDTSQRAMVAAKIATAKTGRPKNSVNSRNGEQPISQEQAAKLMNVGESSVGAAAKVLKDGVPALQKAVESGEVSASAAATVADLPKAEQREAVKKKTVEELAKEKQEQEKRQRERKIWLTLIKQVDPRLAKLIEANPEAYDDETVKRSVPPSCANCLRGKWPAMMKPCAECGKIRAGKQALMFQSEQEPKNPDDPGSDPKPPAHPFEGLMDRITKLSADITKAMNQPTEAGRRLKDYLGACSLIFQDSKGNFFFTPLRGCRSVFQEAGITTKTLGDAQIVAIFEKASGGDPYVSPINKRYKKQRGKK